MIIIILTIYSSVSACRAQESRRAAALELAIETGMATRKGSGKAAKRARDGRNERRDQDPGLRELGGSFHSASGVVHVKKDLWMDKKEMKMKGKGKGKGKGISQTGGGVYKRKGSHQRKGKGGGKGGKR